MGMKVEAAGVAVYGRVLTPSAQLAPNDPEAAALFYAISIHIS